MGYATKLVIGAIASRVQSGQEDDGVQCFVARARAAENAAFPVGNRKRWSAAPTTCAGCCRIHGHVWLETLAVKPDLSSDIIFFGILTKRGELSLVLRLSGNNALRFRTMPARQDATASARIRCEQPYVGMAPTAISDGEQFGGLDVVVPQDS